MEETRISIEDSFIKLDELLKQLEGSELSLEESFDAYAKGLEIIRNCRASIDEVEKKVQILEEGGVRNEF